MPAVGKTQGPEVRHGAEPMTGTERLNGASFEKLREVGLSVSQARRVLECRERQGGFASVDELDVVPGLPHELLGQLKAELTGTAYVPATHVARAEVRPTRVSKMATAALISSLIGFVFAPLGFSSAGIVLGVMARRDMRANPSLAGKGRATAAIILGVIGLVVGVVLLILYLNDRVPAG